MTIPLTPIRCLYRGVDLHGRKTAVVSGGRRFTYAAYGERCERLAAGLASIGVRPGDRVAWLSFNTHQLLEGYYGAPLLRAIVAPLNVRLRPAELAAIVNHVGAKVVIFEREFASVVADLKTNCPAVACFVSIDGEVDPADLTYEALLAKDRIERPDLLSFDERETAALFYTSGSAGRPKGVALSHRSLYLHALNLTATYQLTDAAVELYAIALFHANGWGRPHAAALNGAVQVLARRFEPTQAFGLIERERVTWVGLAPVMAQALLVAPDRGAFDLSSLERLHIGGAPTSPALVAALEAAFHCQVVSAYGLTETSPGATSSRPQANVDPADETDRVRRTASAGWPIHGVDVRVVDPDLRDVPRDGRSVGEVVIRGDHLMSGYFDDEAATDAAVTADGWLLTGDLAVWDVETYITIVDRKKDIIIRGGENISSLQVEAAITAHPAVVECAVVAIPDDTWGEAPAALIVLAPGASLGEEDVRALVRSHLGDFRTPAIVRFLDGPLPRTGAGKVLKRELREPFWAGKPRRVQG